MGRPPAAFAKAGPHYVLYLRTLRIGHLYAPTSDLFVLPSVRPSRRLPHLAFQVRVAENHQNCDRDDNDSGGEGQHRGEDNGQAAGRVGGESHHCRYAGPVPVADDSAVAQGDGEQDIPRWR